MPDKMNFSIKRFEQNKESRDLILSFINYCTKEIQDLKKKIRDKIPEFDFNEIESFKQIEIQSQKIYQLSLRLQHLNLIYQHIKLNGTIDEKQQNELLLEARLKQEEESYQNLRSKTESNNDEIDQEYRRKFKKIYRALANFVHTDTNSINTDGLDENSKERKEATEFNEVLKTTSGNLSSYYNATTKAQFKIFTDVILPNILTKLGGMDDLIQSDKNEINGILELINEKTQESDTQNQIITGYSKFLKYGLTAHKKVFQQAIIEVLNKTGGGNSDLTLEEMHSKYAALLEEKKSFENILDSIDKGLEITVDQRQTDIFIKMNELLEIEKELLDEIENLNQKIKDIGDGANSEISTLAIVNKINNIIRGNEDRKPKGFNPESLKDIQDFLPRFVEALKSAAKSLEFKYVHSYTAGNPVKVNDILFGDDHTLFSFHITQEKDGFNIICQKRSNENGFTLDSASRINTQYYELESYYYENYYINSKFNSESGKSRKPASRFELLLYEVNPHDYQSLFSIKNDAKVNSQEKIDTTNVAIFNLLKKSLQDSLGINIDDFDPEIEDIAKLEASDSANSSSLVLSDKKAEVITHEVNEKFKPKTLEGILNVLPDVYEKIVEYAENNSSIKFKQDKDSKSQHQSIIIYQDTLFSDFILTYQNNKLVRFTLQRRYRKDGFEINPNLDLYSSMYNYPNDHTIENLEISIIDLPTPKSKYDKAISLMPNTPLIGYKMINEVLNDPEEVSQEYIDKVNVEIFEKMKGIFQQDFGIDFNSDQ